MENEGHLPGMSPTPGHLATDESRWVTGVMLPIDGGLLAIAEWPR